MSLLTSVSVCVCVCACMFVVLSRAACTKDPLYCVSTLGEKQYPGWRGTSTAVSIQFCFNLVAVEFAKAVLLARFTVSRAVGGGSLIQARSISD